MMSDESSGGVCSSTFRTAATSIWSSRSRSPAAIEVVLSQPKLFVSWMPAWNAVQNAIAHHRPRRPANTASSGAANSAA